MSDSLLVETNALSRKTQLLPWLVCLSAGLFFFYEFFQLNIFDVINKSLRDDFQLNASQISWMSSMYLWADILFLLPAGAILDRFSSRRVIISAMLVCIIGTLGFALTHNFIWACFFHFMSGIGNAFCFLSCIVLVSHWFQPRRQALVIGCIVTMAFLGGMVAHTPFAYLNEQYGWRNSLLIDAVIGLILLMWIIYIVKDKPNTSISHTTIRKETNYRQLFTNYQTWLGGLYTTFLNLPIMVLCALWGASYLEQVHHLTDITASNIVSLIYVGSMIGCPLAGWISDKQGRRKPIMIIGAAVTILLVLPLIFVSQLSTYTLGTLFFALGLFTSTQVISYPLIAESNAEHNTGIATGLASFVIMGGAGVGQVLFGFLIQSHAQSFVQDYSAMDYRYAMGMFPLTAILGLIAVLLTRETYCKRLT